MQRLQDIGLSADLHFGDSTQPVLGQDVCLLISCELLPYWRRGQLTSIASSSVLYALQAATSAWRKAWVS